MPCPLPGNLLNPGIKPMSFMSPTVAGGFFTTSAAWEAPFSVQVSPKGRGPPPPAGPQRGHCVLSSLPSPWCPLSPMLHRPQAAQRDEAKTSQGPREYQPTPSFLPLHIQKGCFPSLSGFPKVTLVTPVEGGGTALGQEAGDLQSVSSVL